MHKYSFLLLILSSLLFSHVSVAAPGGRAAPVAVDTATIRHMAPQVWVSAEVISRNNSQIASEVEGALLWIADVGSRVKQGELLARIDATLLRQQLDEQQAIVVREQARLDYLIQETERLRSLVKQRNVSQSQLDQTIADQAVSRGDVAVAMARIAQVKERLKRSEIRAPFAGIVTQRLLQQGEWVAVGKPVVQLVDTEALEIRSWATEQVLPYIQLSDLLSVKGSGKTDSAEVITIVPVGEQRSRLYEMRLIPQGDWVVGQSLQVAVPTAVAEPLLTVPRDALVLRRDGSYLFKVTAEGVAQRIVVTTGVAMGAYIAVSGELAEGDQVVINGGERLQPGQQVKAVNQTGVAQ